MFSHHSADDDTRRLLPVGCGGTYGHALYLTIPEALYLRLVNKRK
jgi:hypothetical protein